MPWLFDNKSLLVRCEKTFVDDYFRIVHPYGNRKVLLLDPLLTPHDCVNLEYLVNQIKKKNMVVCEIGSWVGMSTTILGGVVKKYKGKMYAIDKFTKEVGFDKHIIDGKKLKITFDTEKLLRATLQRQELNDTVEILKGSSDKFVETIPDNSLDLIFIDGDHRYKQIRRDLNNYWSKVKSKGIMCGHDYNQKTYDEKHINKDDVDGIHHGVIKAVNEKFNNEKFNKVYQTKESSVWWIRKE